ncbi:(Fe-S)-binding protein [Nostoc linckia z18]|uniref:(Fe-S)-binding protein n=2 Tax=Nostoc linckia TaxID=92942 RepID=A0A9Q6EMK4_NOSLI|nr:ferredoxin [Nostoc linckia]PHK41829.1 (Fe-S)-binding protein [Nostoc linckia z15]PHK47653.1 (Fe-S)-binding protein [Nostoc linckia z16]PHJ59929.1 (Fe-S)-binding protein [Nostoc linckia z1]PHJ67106.1 (Fe-S)-binding protein [Nostoc linckia z3]PHJ69836.1 (Fe-S)-binding protein [Nostoc linckia z2]
MSQFNCWVTPVNEVVREDLATGGFVEYEYFDCKSDVIASLLYTLFEQNWQQVGVGHIVQGSVLELEFHAPPKLCILYDGYLTVAAEGWHLHLCIDTNFGGPLCKTPVEVRKQRLVSRAAFYRRFNAQESPRSWGIQFWNGANEQLMTILLPNPLVDGENLLPEGKPNLAKLVLYEDLRDIYVLGKQPIPFTKNPLKHSYISVCTSTRCLPSRKWQPTFDALKSAVENTGLDIEVRTSGCLEVCQLGPVVFYSNDRTWYTRVNPNVAENIVNEHLVKGNKITPNLYPPQTP